MPTEMASKRSSRDVTNDATISILDPRRFTPTLHANLVSEILALRRDQEDKIKFIEVLEASLHTAKEERETVQQDLADRSKEGRSLKRQLALLEGGTSSALGELAKERDDAVETTADVRKRLDAANKKTRTLEEDSQRTHELWARDKESWEDDRRTLERRIHIAESRLKVVLDEVAAYQAALPNPGATQHDSEVDESGRENDTASVRTMSMTNSIRYSLIHSGLTKPNGKSLADELNFDDEDEQSDFDGRESALSNYPPSVHARNPSRESAAYRFHARNQSMDSLKRSGSVARGRLFMNPSVLETLEGEDEESEPVASKLSYTDTGVQYSPPPSPKLSPEKAPTLELPITRSKSAEAGGFGGFSRGDGEIEANQRRKRVHVGRPLGIDPLVPRRLMVSSSVQTTTSPITS